MGVKDILKQNNVPLPPDFDERLKVLELGLRRDPSFQSALEEFKNKQVGGANIPYATPVGKIGNIGLPDAIGDDWLGPKMVSFLDMVTSPEARAMLKTLFFFLFFLKYLEATPIFGNILSAALDTMISAAKALIKFIQTMLPPTFGLLPIPYASMSGLIMAAIFGSIAWPMVALVSFTRMDFAAAIESYLRIVPPPFGSVLADNFMETNRMFARIDANRQKLAYDIVSGLLLIEDAINSVSNTVNNTVTDARTQVDTSLNQLGENISSVTNKLTEVARTPAPAMNPTNVPSLNPYTHLESPFSRLPQNPPRYELPPLPQTPPIPLLPQYTAPTAPPAPAPVPEPTAPPAPVPEPTAPPAPAPVPVPEPTAPPAPAPVPVPESTAPPRSRTAFEPIAAAGRNRKNKRLSTNRRKKVNKWTKTRRTKSKTH